MDTLGADQSARQPRLSAILPGVAIALILVLFVSLFALQVQKNPLRMDEVDYFQCMQNIVRLGLPLYYAGEVSVNYDLLIYLSARRLGGQDYYFYRYKPETGILKETFFAITNTSSRYTYGMWHPPLYIYLGALFFRFVPLTSDNSSWLRYFNLIFSIGLFSGMAALSRELDRQRYLNVFLLALILYTFNSLAVRGSLLIDYNATLGPCLATWFIVGILWSEKNQRLHWGLIVLTNLVLFTSLGIAASLLLSIVVYSFIFRRPCAPLLSVLLGTLTFFPLFLIFCRTFGLPFTQPFLHNLQRVGFGSTTNWATQIYTATKYSYFYFQEIGLPVALTTGILFFRTALFKESQNCPARCLAPTVITTSLLSQASLGAEAYGFAKYILFLLPVLFIYLAGEALTLLSIGSRWLKTITLIALIAITSISGYHSLWELHRPGGTLYYKGEHGIISVAHQLRATSDPSQTILSPKDVAFFADRKFVQWYGKYLTDVDFIRNTVQTWQIQYIVINADLFDSMQGAPAVYLRDNFLVQARVGSFVLLKKFPPSQSPFAP